MPKKDQNQIVPVEVQTKAQKDAVTLSAVADKIVVTTASEEEKAYDALGQIKTALKTIEKERKKITSPLNQAVKAANAMFKTLSTPFRSADSLIREKIMEFRQLQAAKAEAEQERREKIQTYHEEQGHKTHDLAKVEPEVAEKTITTKRWTFEVKDIGLVPTKYLEINSALVRQAIRDGERKIKGLEIYQEEGLRV